MASTLEAMKAFMTGLDQDSEGQKVLSYVRRTFLVKLDDGESFTIQIKDGAITFKEGDIKDPDLAYEVTLIETSRNELMGVIEKKTRPIDFFLSGKSYVSSMSCARAYNSGLFRLWRRAQEPLGRSTI